MSQDSWWKGLPRWLKLVVLLVAVPAWAVIIFCAGTGESQSPPAIAAFAVFVGATLLCIIFDRRRNTTTQKFDGVDVHGPED